MMVHGHTPVRADGEAVRVRPIALSAALDAATRERLERIFTEPTGYVDHPSFRNPRTGDELFGPTTRLLDAARPWCNAGVKLDVDERAGSSATLSAEQETRLFLRLNYARRQVALTLGAVGNRPTRRECTLLLFWSARVEETRSAIVQANMPLVLAMAKRARLGGVDFAELISEGNMALLRSVDKFDCSRGFKFSTYACRAIIKSFSRVTMRTSRYRGHFPTEFDPSLEKSDYADRCRTVEESNCVDDLRTIMSRNLAALNQIEQTVIRERFALDAAGREAAESETQPATPKTLEEVGRIIGVTKERVRQIQNRALAKLRSALEERILAA
jgi:RNA polymerase primary sigma factor